MLDIYELPKRMTCSYAFSDAYSIIVGALRMTICERYAWEDDTELTRYFVCRTVLVAHLISVCVSLPRCSPLESGLVMIQGANKCVHSNFENKYMVIVHATGENSHFRHPDL